MDKKIKETIQKFILRYYGESELLEPCYDIELLSKWIAEEIKED